MEKYRMKLVRPWISFVLGAALLTGTLAVSTKNVDAAASVKTVKNVKVTKSGKLISKRTGKVVKGVVKFNGKVYNNGKKASGVVKGIYYKLGKAASGVYKNTYYKVGKKASGVYKNTYYKVGKKATGVYKNTYYKVGKKATGVYKNVYYKVGKKATGTYKGKYYSKGKVFSGLKSGVYYEKGTKATGTFEGKYYETGKLLTGLQLTTGDLYIEGVLNTGQTLFEGQLYSGPTLSNGLVVFNGKLYNEGKLNKGVIQVNGKWYSGPSLATGIIQTPNGTTIVVINGVEYSAGGSNSGGVTFAAIAKINAYAGDSSKPTPIVTDYTMAGVTGVTTENLTLINEAIAAKNFGDADSTSKIQAIIDSAIAIAKINAYAGDSSNLATAPTVEDYTAAGVAHVITENLTLVNEAVAAKNFGDADSTSEIQAIINPAIALAVVYANINGTDADLLTALKAEALAFISINDIYAAPYNAALTGTPTKEQIQTTITNVNVAQPVVSLIAALSPNANATAVTAARNAYDALALEEQKALVTNFSALETAEANVIKIEADLAALTEEVIKGTNDDLVHVKANLTGFTTGILATGANGSAITWLATTTDGATIASNGTVTRSSANNVNDTIKLTATATLNGITKTKNFDVTILEAKAPSASTVNITSNNSNTSYAKTGDIITLTFTTSEEVKLPVVMIAGKTATLSKISDYSYKAEYTLTSTETAGIAPVSIILDDLVGNSAIDKTVDTGSVMIDTSGPIISGVDNEQFSKDSLTPIITDANIATITLAKDDVSATTFKSGTAITEEGKYKLVATDQAGNSTTYNFTIDKTAPTNQNSVLTSAQTVKGGTSFAIASSGDVTNKVWVCPVGQTTVPTAIGTTVTQADGDALTIAAPSEEGTYYLYVSDAAGNISSASTATITVDNTPPTASVETTAVNNSMISTVTVKSTEKGTAYLVLDTADITTKAGADTAVSAGTAKKTAIGMANADTIMPITDLAEGTYKVVAVDAVGNVSPKSTNTVLIDNTPPTVSGVTDKEFYNAAVSPTFETGATATLRKNSDLATPFTSGDAINGDGSYQLVVTDKARNETTLSFVIDTVKPVLTSSSIQSSNPNQQLAKTGDMIKLHVDANEDVGISDTQIKIGETLVGPITVNDAGDSDASTWELSYVVKDGDPVEGTVGMAFKMTDPTGNVTDVNFGTITNGSSVVVDSKPATMTRGVIESTNQYVDVTFSKGVFGGSAGSLSALETADFTAVMTKIGGDLNTVSASINSVTNPDGTALVGGESVIRVNLSIAGTIVQGDKVEIKPAENAILDHAGNVTASTETTGILNLKPLVSYNWDETNNSIKFTSGLTVSTYSNTKVQLIGKKGDPNVFITTPTAIGGDDKVKISVTPGWDGEAIFGASANGIYAQATAKDTIQFTANTQCSPGDSGCYMTTDYRQDHLFVIIQHYTDPTIKTILDLNIDSKRENPIIINE